jgi:hypothetical protein
VATDTPTRNDRWLSADELREIAPQPESGPPPAPLHRTPETRSPRPVVFAVTAVMLAALFVVVVVL